MNKNKLFWLLQISGWGSLLFNTATKFVLTIGINKLYIIFEGVLLVISGIICSCGLRYYLKAHTQFGHLKGQNLFKILMAYIVASVALSFTMFIPFPLYNALHPVPAPINGIIIFSNALNAFIFMLMWLVLYIGIKSYMRFNELKIDQLKLNRELKTSQLTMLKGQINPHFMFNCLNNIKALMLEDVDKSREMITRLSELLRNSLAYHDDDTVSLAQELLMVNHTIALSKIQFEQRLRFIQEIDVDVDDREVPPMMIQMLVENALKHGIANIKEGGEICLTIHEEEHKMIIIVINSGQLNQQKNTTQIGLENISKRLKIIYKNKAFFEIINVENYVHARIEVPVI